MSVDLPSIPEAVSNISSLQFLARKAVEGTLSGLHRSGVFGSSIEFAEHKPYSMGDDLRHIDWKVYGRADKFYLKRFEEETNLRGYLLMDASDSMDFGTIGYTKLDYAKVLSASLAYLLIQQQDLVGLVRFGPAENLYIPPRGRMPHFQYISDLIQKTQADGRTQLQAALSYLFERLHRRAAITVFSDFIAPIAEIEATAKIFRAGHHDVFWFHILDPAEIDFPFRDWARFEGLEGEPSVSAHAREAAKAYLRGMKSWLDELKNIALENHVHYRLVRTDEQLSHVLASTLL